MRSSCAAARDIHSWAAVNFAANRCCCDVCIGYKGPSCARERARRSARQSFLMRWRGPQGTRNDPDNFGSAAGGFTPAFGGWADSKLECVEFPAGGVRRRRGAASHPRLAARHPCRFSQTQVVQASTRRRRGRRSHGVDRRRPAWALRGRCGWCSGKMPAALEAVHVVL
jgi:hypothetical protein